jgi:hypothetical protein
MRTSVGIWSGRVGGTREEESLGSAKACKQREVRMVPICMAYFFLTFPLTLRIMANANEILHSVLERSRKDHAKVI